MRQSDSQQPMINILNILVNFGYSFHRSHSVMSLDVFIETFSFKIIGTTIAKER